MNLAAATLPDSTWTVARLRRHFGGIPAERLVLRPFPGTATERDLIAWNDQGATLCELADGCLLEKAMGARESLVALIVARAISAFLETKPLGVVLGSDGAIRLSQGLVRAPDVSYISWESIGGDEFPDQPIPNLAIDLAIEVLSRGNTAREMERKICDYFEHGTKLVWIIDPRKKTVDAYGSPTETHRLKQTESLTAPKLLPGFSLPIRALFAGFRRPRS